MLADQAAEDNDTNILRIHWPVEALQRSHRSVYAKHRLSNVLDKVNLRLVEADNEQLPLLKTPCEVGLAEMVTLFLPPSSFQAGPYKAVIGHSAIMP